MESSSDSAELAGELPGWHLYVTQADRSRYDCTTGQFGGYKGQRSTWFTMVKMQIVQVFIHSFTYSSVPQEQSATLGAGGGSSGTSEVTKRQEWEIF